MSKKNRQNPESGLQTSDSVQPAQVPVVPLGNTDAPSGGALPQDTSKKYCIIFWAIIAITAAMAWILAITMPNVSESIIERWLMGALAVALAIFLFLYK